MNIPPCFLPNSSNGMMFTCFRCMRRLRILFETDLCKAVIFYTVSTYSVPEVSYVQGAVGWLFWSNFLFY